MTHFSFSQMQLGMAKMSVSAALFLVASFQAQAVAAAPEVVVSIKPVHSLVAGVVGDVKPAPKLLVPGTASPHLYQMRPAEAQMLKNADLVIWIGEALETFLERPIETLGEDAVALALHEAAGMRLLPNREGGIWDHDEEAEVHMDEHDDHGHEHDEFDMHLWLDPDNAKRIVTVVADALSRIDPANSEVWRSNADKTAMRIDSTEAQLRRRLAPVQGRPFVVFHDGYGYFEHAFDLEGFGAVAVDPSRPIGAKRLAELREALEHHEVACVFTEAQFEPKLVQTLIEGTKVSTAVLDPIGATIEAGPDAWFKIMEDLGTAFVQCLGDE